MIEFEIQGTDLVLGANCHEDFLLLQRLNDKLPDEGAELDMRQRCLTIEVAATAECVNCANVNDLLNKLGCMNGVDSLRFLILCVGESTDFNDVDEFYEQVCKAFSDRKMLLFLLKSLGFDDDVEDNLRDVIKILRGRHLKDVLKMVEQNQLSDPVTNESGKDSTVKVHFKL